MKCPNCNGRRFTGRIRYINPTPITYNDFLGRPTTLSLLGEIVDDFCKSCDGSGEVTEARYVRLVDCRPPTETERQREIRHALNKETSVGNKIRRGRYLDGGITRS